MRQPPGSVIVERTKGVISARCDRNSPPENMQKLLFETADAGDSDDAIIDPGQTSGTEKPQH